MKNKYYIKERQQFLVACSGLIKYIGLGVICCYFLNLKYHPIYIFIALFFFIFDILPALILHLQYLKVNWGADLIIDTINEDILYRKGGIAAEHKFHEITSFKIISSFGGGQYNAGWYAFGEYRYCEFVFKDDTQMIITCLMINDIQNTLENLLRIKPEKRRKVFAFISS